MEIMEEREDLADIYAQLTPENRACLTACTRLCRIAENAAKKEFDRGHTPGMEGVAGTDVGIGSFFSKE
ncbi:hypothetical protein AGMMS49942_01530 [Spirochaetia bacterium]|nr:hypothetical protein AGMMS49942_01530 [Spirochaetia bacterium]